MKFGIDLVFLLVTKNEFPASIVQNQAKNDEFDKPLKTYQNICLNFCGPEYP